MSAAAIANAVATFASGSMQLKDLITQVRRAKTAAEEREIIKKESAFLRNAFSSKGDKFKARNLVKLMYIHMLGYPTQFGQLECLKLITQGTYSDKRVGYLALMILLDERAETLMLVTNSMKNDLNNFNDVWVVVNALTAMGNICSSGMASDLAADVERLMSQKYLADKGVSLTMQNHIRKKALLAATRILRKQPDLMHNFMEPATTALSDRNHAIVLAGVTLMMQILRLDEDGSVKAEYAKQVPELCVILDQLHSSRFNADYNVNQVNNPFLQVKILKLLGALGSGDASATEHMTDILSKIAASRGIVRASNVASAIAYQCVTTIMQIEPVKSLRTHAVNIMGNFLKMPNNNMRYVALNTLVQAVAVDASSVQRHRNVVVECVKDSDVSIRRRALDLIYALVNQDNITTLAKELLTYLAVTDVEFKPSLTERICVLVQKFATDNRWYIDSMLTVMVQAGRYVKEPVMRAFVVKVSNCDVPLQAYATRQAFRLVCGHRDAGSDALLTTCLWLLGEYGEMLTANHAMLADEEAFTCDGDVEMALVDAVQTLAEGSRSTEVQAYAIMAVMKLTAKLPKSADRLTALLEHFRTSVDQEVQQRCCEILNIISQTGGALPSVLAERIPVLDEKMYAGNLQDSVVALQAQDGAADVSAAQTADLLGDLLGSSPSIDPNAPQTRDILGDLDDLLSGPASTAPAGTTSTPEGGLDLLDMLSGPPAPTPASSAPAGAVASAAGDLDLFGDLEGPPTPSFEPITAWSEDGLTITFAFEKTGADTVNIHATYSNSGSQPVSAFGVQAALPKSMSVQMMPQEGGTTLGASNANTLKQRMTCTNNTKGAKPLAMRLRISYTARGENKVVVTQVNNLPPGL